MPNPLLVDPLPRAESPLDFASGVEALHNAMRRLLDGNAFDTGGTSPRDTFCFACRWLIVNVADPENRLLLGSRRPRGSRA